MFDRLEKDGMLYSYLSASIFMVYALMSLGYSPGHHLILKAVKGMKKLVTVCQGRMYAENSTSTVWDTALVSYASQKAGKKQEDPVITKSFSYLLNRQQMKKADWAIHNRHAAPGGFGFSDINTNNPDCDDTQIVLKAIPRTYAPVQWKRGFHWLLSMQNRDGGFSAFEKIKITSCFDICRLNLRRMQRSIHRLPILQAGCFISLVLKRKTCHHPFTGKKINVSSGS